MSNAQPSPARSSMSPGAVLAGKYRVERILGHSRNDVDVEARDTARDERVSVRVVRPEHGAIGDRFLCDARAAMNIASEHAARVLDAGVLDGGDPFVVTELLDGSDLGTILANDGVFRCPDAVDYVIQACDALAEAHVHGIAHGDLEPADLFLFARSDGSPIVKVLGLPSPKTSEADAAREANDVDARADVLGLGALLYELLTGRRLPREGAADTRAPLLGRRPDVPGPLAAVIEGVARARDGASPFASVADLVVALAPFAPPRSRAIVERVAQAAGLPIPPEPPSMRANGIFPMHHGAGVEIDDPDTLREGDALAPQHEQEWPQIMDESTPPPPAVVDLVRRSVPPPPPPPSPPSTVQIVLAPYSGPISARAAATFAQRHSITATFPPPGIESKLKSRALIALGLLAMGGLGAAAVVALTGPKTLPPTTTLTLQPNTPSEPAAPHTTPDEHATQPATDTTMKPTDPPPQPAPPEATPPKSSQADPLPHGRRER